MASSPNGKTTLTVVRTGSVTHSGVIIATILLSLIYQFIHQDQETKRELSQASSLAKINDEARYVAT